MMRDALNSGRSGADVVVAPGDRRRRDAGAVLRSLDGRDQRRRHRPRALVGMRRPYRLEGAARANSTLPRRSASGVTTVALWRRNDTSLQIHELP